jgi:hypothetical protein
MTMHQLDVDQVKACDSMIVEEDTPLTLIECRSAPNADNPDYRFCPTYLKLSTNAASHHTTATTTHEPPAELSGLRETRMLYFPETALAVDKLLYNFTQLQGSAY